MKKLNKLGVSILLLALLGLYTFVTDVAPRIISFAIETVVSVSKAQDEYDRLTYGKPESVKRFESIKKIHVNEYF